MVLKINYHYLNKKHYKPKTLYIGLHGLIRAFVICIIFIAMAGALILLAIRAINISDNNYCSLYPTAEFCIEMKGGGIE